ncbi:MAG: DUF1599 domain-containing protein [Luteibaculaceae bacterium]
MDKTITQYRNVIATCKELFAKKTSDYGTAWRILRPSSLTDQIYIKANRIRTIQETGVSKVEEGIETEFIGIINYCVMALIQLEPKNLALEIPQEVAEKLYQSKVDIALQLMQNKNHDYGEAWRNMRVSSLTDLILMKLLRLKSIENNDGKTQVSEGAAANYLDILNYSVFALILISEQQSKA